MIEASEIFLQRAEGPSPLPGPVVIMGAGVWTLANQQLRQWSSTAPGGPLRTLGADKTDFTVTFTDGYDYNGCFMLRSGGPCSLAEHIRSFARRLNELADASRARGATWYIEDATAYNLWLKHYKIGD